jgi:hypothetical protein
MKVIWIARDKNGELFIYTAKPVRRAEKFKYKDYYQDTFDAINEYEDPGYPWTKLPKNFYPEVTWKNSPKKLIIDNKDEN